MNISSSKILMVGPMPQIFLFQACHGVESVIAMIQLDVHGARNRLSP